MIGNFRLKRMESAIEEVMQYIREQKGDASIAKIDKTSDFWAIANVTREAKRIGLLSGLGIEAEKIERPKVPEIEVKKGFVFNGMLFVELEDCIKFRNMVLDMSAKGKCFNKNYHYERKVHTIEQIKDGTYNYDIKTEDYTTKEKYIEYDKMLKDNDAYLEVLLEEERDIDKSIKVYEGLRNKLYALKEEASRIERIHAGVINEAAALSEILESDEAIEQILMRSCVNSLEILFDDNEEEKKEYIELVVQDVCKEVRN